MKNIPIRLVETFAKLGTSTAYLIRIVARDGTVYGFTTADRLIRYNDGNGPVIYRPNQELMPQNIQTSADLSVDNTKLEGWFNEVLEKLVLAGAFDFAEISIYRVAQLNLDYGHEVVAFGTVGEVEFNSDAKDRRKVEFRGLGQQLTQTVNKFYSLTCRAEFGDDDCGMPFVWFAGVIESVGLNPYMQFKVSGIAQPADFFELGVIYFASRDNAGAELEIESWAADGTVKLSYPAPYLTEPGTIVRLRRDCGKTESDCLAYGNIVNMQAEHLTPVEDASLMVPGAYIKSQNAL